MSDGTKQKKLSAGFIWGWPIIVAVIFFFTGYWLYNNFPKKAEAIYNKTYPTNIASQKPFNISDLKSNLTNTILTDNKDNSERTGPIGDTFGGTLGPLIALIAAFFSFLAFWAQYIANRLQVQQFLEQKSDFDKQFIEQELTQKIERFENKFYELLKLHKENLHETSIGGYDGKQVRLRKAFVSMYKELRYSFFVTKLKYQELKVNGLDLNYSDEELVELAYIFFYTGVGVHSDILNEAMIGKKYNENLICSIKKHLSHLHINHKTLKQDRNIPILELKEEGNAMLPKSYRPFGGHMSRLGHYYRHLYQVVKFVVQQDEKFIGKEKKLEYLKTLRAQLSDHEQVMLYYNALAKFGSDWITNDYFTEYRMIHNIPIPLAEFGESPRIKFKDYISKNGNIFEWDD